MRRRALAALAASLALPAALAAQGPGLAVGAGAYHERYDFLSPRVAGVERVSLTTVPLAARAVVLPRLAVELSTAYARGSLVGPADTVELSGLVDTEVRASYTVLPGRLTVAAAALLPTGAATQTLEETRLAGLVAADLLPFRISSWGSGGAVGLVTTYALPLGAYAVGVSAGYTMGREFEPLEEAELAYRPGDELRVRVAVDRTFGAAGKASLVLGVQRYADDRFGEESVFEPGDRLEALASYVFAAGTRASGAVYAGVQHRGEGSVPAAGLSTPAQDLLTAGGGFRLPLGGATLVPALDVRVFRRSDGLGQGALASLGASLEVPLAPGVRLVPALRARFGEALLWEGAETSVRGAELGLGLRVGS